VRKEPEKKGGIVPGLLLLFIGFPALYGAGSLLGYTITGGPAGRNASLVERLGFAGVAILCVCVFAFCVRGVLKNPRT
jgi:hypothetical protein